MEKFWVLTEHMLNSVLFVLGTLVIGRNRGRNTICAKKADPIAVYAGGMVWGRIISNEDPDHEITMHFYPEDCKSNAETPEMTPLSLSLLTI